ncbi:MAG: HEPN domain-containing protein [Planctomycetota bacterium]
MARRGGDVVLLTWHNTKSAYMSGNQQYERFWWMPQTPNDRLVGELTYKADGKITLALRGETRKPKVNTLAEALQYESDQSESIKIIHGETLSGKPISLFRSFTTNYSPFRGPIHGKITANTGLIGCHLVDEDEPNLISCQFELANLDAWVYPKQKAFSSKMDQKNGKLTYATRYKPPKDILVSINDTTTLKIESHLLFSESAHPNNSVKLEKTTTAALKHETKTTISTLYAGMTKFLHLFELLCGHPSQIRKVWMTYQDAESNKARCEFLASHHAASNLNDELNVYDMLFSHRDIQRRFPSITKKWFNLYDSYRNPLGVHFAEIRRPSDFVEQQFLNQVRAIEGIHRQMYLNKDYELPPAAFKNKVLTLTQNMSKRDAVWIKQKLQHANQTSLRKRLLQITEINPDLSALIIGNTQLFAKLVASARNDESHQFPTNTTTDNIEFRYHGAASKLRVLADMALLHLLGLPNNVCLEHIKKCRKYWFYANNETWPWHI